MNTTNPGSNATFTSNTENATLSTLTDLTTLTATTSSSATVRQPPSYSSDIHDPEFTIIVVLGLSLLLAGFAAFLAVCRPSEQDGDAEASCAPGESLTRRRRPSSEPQLKVWKRLGSYRRSYNLSFRRPPHRRPHERGSARAPQSPPRQTTQPEASVEPHLTMPCLFDYVTEIWLEDHLKDAWLFSRCDTVYSSWLVQQTSLIPGEGDERTFSICFNLFWMLGGWSLIQSAGI